MKRKIMVAGIVCFLTIPGAFSQVIIDGEFRPRTEFRHGFKRPLPDSLDPALLCFQRTRLNLGYQSKILNAGLILQDSRIWGAADTKQNPSKIEVFEAWAECLISSGLSVKFGRQSLKYDDQRLLGAANWSNTGNAHDILVLKYKPNKDWQVHTGFAYNNIGDVIAEAEYTVEKMYKTMGFQWLSKTFDNGLSIKLLSIEEGLPKISSYNLVYLRYTTGTTINFLSDSSKFTFNLACYYQGGKSTSFEDLSAMMATVRVGYKVYQSNILSLGLDYYSGTKPGTTSGTSNTFNRLYGANHMYNGYMEYWTSIPKSGLYDYYGIVTGKLTSRWLLEIACHYFRLDKDYQLSQVNIDKNLGTEFDIITTFNVSKEISIQAGYSTYFNSASTNKYFKVTGISSGQNQWAYLMLTIKPSFYKTPVENK